MAVQVTRGWDEEFRACRTGPAGGDGTGLGRDLWVATKGSRHGCAAGGGRPRILIADEPTGSLDSRAGEEVMALFHQFHEQGKTIVMVTHEPDIAAHAQRIIRVRDGRLDGGPEAFGSALPDSPDGSSRRGAAA